MTDLQMPGWPCLAPAGWNDCGDEGFEISVGNGFSCTITKTVFFEGIPTLSRYGMVILALLMLGVGFVGFRRFV